MCQKVLFLRIRKLASLRGVLFNDEAISLKRLLRFARNDTVLNYQHGVAVAVKTVAFFDGFFVGLHYQIIAAESADQH